MINLKCDYTAGAHEKILKKIVDTNFEKTLGYGEDHYTDEASELIKSKLNNEKCDIYFLAGGTITNLTVISHILKSFQAVIACETGHVSTHETGAIEATGHKVIEIKGKDFKITVEEIERVLSEHIDCHMVQPKLVYITNPTELGTLYSKDELKSLKKVCEDNGLFLYIDGARLASALSAEINDIKLEDYAKYSDIFYIGGTKCGALFGEAIVVLNDKLKEDFKFSIKQRGGLFSKGRLIALQFKEFFKKNLYYEIGEHSNRLAKKIKVECKNLGIEFFSNSYTNQIFPIIKNDKLKPLSEKVIFTEWQKYNDDYTVVRFITSFITTDEEIEEFLKILADIYKN